MKHDVAVEILWQAVKKNMAHGSAWGNIDASLRASIAVLEAENEKEFEFFKLTFQNENETDERSSNPGN